MDALVAGSERKELRVLVLGGAGFIGRHAVRALLGHGYRVAIGSRHPARAARRLPDRPEHCEILRVRMERMLRPSDWDALLSEVNVVVNCVGILRQRGAETYERVHHLAVAALAGACVGNGCRLIHVSALGLDNPVRSRFLLSKRRGEAEIRASGADWWLVRPSLLDGEGGFGARWLQRVAGWPLHLLPANACGRIAVFDAAVLGQALAALVTRPAPDRPSRRIFELGGERTPTLVDHLVELRGRHQVSRPVVLRVPAWMARLTAHLCDLLHLTPYSFGHYELLKYDNVPRPNRLRLLLPGGRGSAPHEIPADVFVVPDPSDGRSAAASGRPRAAPPGMAPSRA